MDNNFQSENQLTQNETSADLNSVDDIQFDDGPNIEDIQNKLMAEMAGVTEVSASPNEVSEEVDYFADIDKALEAEISKTAIVKKQDVSTSSTSGLKKYVIYIDPDNINYMEGLSLDERKAMINNVLREQSFLSEQERVLKNRRTYITHLMVVILTFAICFPLLFVIVNNGARISIENYNASKDNFIKLYKERGKLNSTPNVIK